MKNSLRKLLATTLVAVVAVSLSSPEALAGGHYNGHHGDHYNNNRVWAAVGVGILGGALIGAAVNRPAPVYYQQPPVVYVPPPVYVERPVYVQQPAYVPPPSYLRYDPWCRCYR